MISIKQKVLSFQEDGKKRKMVIKIEFTPLSLSNCKIVHFKKGFDKSKIVIKIELTPLPELTRI